MIKRMLLLSLFLLSTVAATCTTNTNGSGPNGYAIARACVQGGQVAVSMGDSVFEIWCAVSDGLQCAEARGTYSHLRLDVLDGLQVVLAGIDLAESQSSGLDLPKLMAQAEAAWSKLYKFLADLGVMPTSLPSTVTKSTQAKKEKLVLPELKLKLPKTLLPPARK
jgi:hypothetical protein